ncbi:Nuclear receptor-binding protein [Nymphon striatum]|nr:Nuclear receptor-binding protein [Nymphon striatum]
MDGSQLNQDTDGKPLRESADDSEDESEILEESPCGRWLKRREEVEQRDVPGIDVAYLAMDTEEGVEVVWNEVQFSERKNFKSQEAKIRQVFDNLTQLDHPNIVKFHKYWTDTDNDQPRIIFITEYMSSGSLKQFLKKTKQTKKLPRSAWKRWCTQILSALSYLHSCTPPIIHGNLTCDTILIQHNGLVKIGSVAPDAIHHHVKTCRENMKNMHFIAPEYGVKSYDAVTPAVDIYAFGMCALEIAALEVPGNGENGTVITDEVIKKTINSLQDPVTISFINNCLNKQPKSRPTARELLFHAVLFEVHSLRLLSAHILVNNPNYVPEMLPDMKSAVNKSEEDGSTIGAEIMHKDGKSYKFKVEDAPLLELEKFLEDVKNGVFPLTAMALPQSKPTQPRAASPEVAETVKQDTPEIGDVESRRVMDMMCNANVSEEDGALWSIMATISNIPADVAIQWIPSQVGIAGNEKADYLAKTATCLGPIQVQMTSLSSYLGKVSSSNSEITLLLKMDDQVNRQLSGKLEGSDTAHSLADELVFNGLINDADRESVTDLIEEALTNGTPSAAVLHAADEKENVTNLIEEALTNGISSLAVLPVGS